MTPPIIPPVLAECSTKIVLSAATCFHASLQPTETVSEDFISLRESRHNGSVVFELLG
jgi:hypothetical protein